MIPRRAPVTTAELAGMLGRSRDWLYRNLARLHLEEGLPQPLTARGHKVWDRASVEAWLGRHHPMAPAQPANDDGAPPPDATREAWSHRLAEAYGRT